MHAQGLHIHTRIVNTCKEGGLFNDALNTFIYVSMASAYKDTCLFTEDTYLLTYTADDAYFYYMHAQGYLTRTHMDTLYVNTRIRFAYRLFMYTSGYLDHHTKIVDTYI